MPPTKRRATTSTRMTKQSKVRKMPDSSSRPSTRATRPVKKKQPPRPISAACATTPPQPLDEREGSVITLQPGASVGGASVIGWTTPIRIRIHGAWYNDISSVTGIVADRDSLLC
ncbi:uncharacterized protein LOC125675921 [Ostrea edulis]|uniref:uncharacterized protein LOC125675921 n=1 Tax=Ostrea edulis TaxID=37623 RepID=UPI0024AEABF4|nr:uncharacterized protein LOC125675921 [Ostrea edulis]